MKDTSLLRSTEKNAVVGVIESFYPPENSSALSEELIVIERTQNQSENIFQQIK